MIYLIIYIGAIAILFLFVIMMFNLHELVEDKTNKTNYSPVISGFCLLILTTLGLFIKNKTVVFVEYDKYFNEFINKKIVLVILEEGLSSKIIQAEF